MKKTNFGLAFIALIMSMASCSGRIYNHVITYDDEFRNNSKRITRISIRNEERRTEINTAKIVFEKVKEVSAGESFSSAYFVIERSSTSFRIESEGYMKAGGKKFELKLVDPVSEYKTENETTAMSTESSDSTGYSSFQMSDTNTRQWYDEKFITDFSPEMVKAISSADELIFRFYFGPSQATYILDGKKLKSVQRVFQE
jgi:hypothetical protein